MARKATTPPSEGERHAVVGLGIGSLAVTPAGRSLEQTVEQPTPASTRSTSATESRPTKMPIGPRSSRAVKIWGRAQTKHLASMAWTA